MKQQGDRAYSLFQKLCILYHSYLIHGPCTYYLTTLVIYRHLFTIFWCVLFFYFVFSFVNSGLPESIKIYNPARCGHSSYSFAFQSTEILNKKTISNLSCSTYLCIASHKLRLFLVFWCLVIPSCFEATAPNAPIIILELELVMDISVLLVFKLWPCSF